ncbi:Maf family protein [Acidobacteria bacterium AH-259-G07]|nr:Maf family protein [Acidobacteria bacterium AH-259-G07]
MSKVVLASASPRRRELLETLQIPFEIVSSGATEKINSVHQPVEAVRLLAQQKAREVAQQLETGLVIGADTAIDLRGELLAKPAGEQDATRMLRLLRNRTHRVVTGIAVFDVSTGRIEVSSVTTELKMGNFTDRQLAKYVLSGEPMDKAGAYAIQGEGGALVECIEGCYNNVVGLPLCELTVLLERFGVVPNKEEDVCQLPSGDPCPRLCARPD